MAMLHNLAVFLISAQRGREGNYRQDPVRGGVCRMRLSSAASIESLAPISHLVGKAGPEAQGFSQSLWELEG